MYFYISHLIQMLHGHPFAQLVAQVIAEGAVASPCSVSHYCFQGDCGRFIVVPPISCDSSEAIRAQHHPWESRHVSDVHVMLHLGLAHRMQIVAAQTATALASHNNKMSRGDAAAHAAIRATIHFECKCLAQSSRQAQDATFIHRCGC